MDHVEHERIAGKSKMDALPTKTSEWLLSRTSNCAHIASLDRRARLRGASALNPRTSRNLFEPFDRHGAARRCWVVVALRALSTGGGRLRTLRPDRHRRTRRSGGRVRHAGGAAGSRQAGWGTHRAVRGADFSAGGYPGARSVHADRGRPWPGFDDFLCADEVGVCKDPSNARYRAARPTGHRVVHAPALRKTSNATMSFSMRRRLVALAPNASTACRTIRPSSRQARRCAISN